VFRTLIRKGKRDYIKEFTRVCNAELKSGIYNAVRNYLFQESYKLNADQINELSHVLTLIFDLRKQNNAVVNKITAHLISQLENLLQTGQFNKTTAKNLTVRTILNNVNAFFHLSLIFSLFSLSFSHSLILSLSLSLKEQLFRLALYKNLFPDELNTHKEQSAEELSQIFQSKFPPDIVEVQFSKTKKYFTNSTSPKKSPTRETSHNLLCDMFCNDSWSRMRTQCLY
jgi:hypothetical protein